MRITDRIKHAWNAFSTPQLIAYDRGYSSSRPMFKLQTSFTTSSYVSSLYNRIALDVAMTGFKHVKIDPENKQTTDLKTGLNECLTVEANIDQSYIQFIHDLVYSMFDEGVVAVVPVDTTLSPESTGGYDIKTMRVGKIISWLPKHVELQLYNEETGQNERISLEKKSVAIVENPLYAVVNDENSTLKRLIRKLNQLDDIDAIVASNRLDLLISVPYGVKTDLQRQAAEKRIRDIESQLATGRNGIAYIDATEKAMQLNRPMNPQLPESIRNLTDQFYNQIGLTQNILDGTASETELRTYYSRTIDPISEAIVAEFNRKFITKTARTQGQRITNYRDMFKFVPVETIASLGDTLKRNELGTTNEIRDIMGWVRSNDPKADILFNPNIADKNQEEGHGFGKDTGPEDVRRKIIKPKDSNKQKAEILERKVEKLEKELDN